MVRSITQTFGLDAGPLPSLFSGFVFAKRYQIEEKIGAGGMGVVYRAHDTLLDRPVALKILAAEVNRIHAERFRREVVAGQKGHPNLVTTFDAGIWQNRHYIAMEYVEGRTLQELIDAKGPLDSDAVNRLIEDLLAGLAHLHASGITHRDVKSRNILITEDGTAKLADFGLARIPEDQTVTHSFNGVGTPAFMAPEQIRGEPVGPATDLYAAGIVLFEAVAGVRPFEGESQAAILHHQLRTSPDARLLESASRHVRNLILRLLEKKPTRRYPDAQACLDAWRGSRVRRPFPRRALALASTLAALLLVIGGIFLTSAQAVRVEVQGPELRGISRLGTTAWTRVFPGELQFQPVPATANTPAGFLVAHSTKIDDASTSEIVLLDRHGHEVFRYAPAEDRSILRDHQFAGTLTVTRLLPPADVDGDGMPDFLAVLNDNPWYFSTIVKIHPDRHPAYASLLLLNPGYIEWAKFTDADHDGEPEWYVAAMNNELLHTACVYRVDGSMKSWPPPRFGAQPSFPAIRWFTPFSRKGGNSFRSAMVTDGGGLKVTMSNGEVLDFDSWGNRIGKTAAEDPFAESSSRMERYKRLSAIHLLLLNHDVENAKRLLSELDSAKLKNDRIAEGFYLLLEGRAALEAGQYRRADRWAKRSFAAAPISDDALMLAVTARILDRRWGEVPELLLPNSQLTMGSPSDFQEIRGILAWLEGSDDEAWTLFDTRGTLPPGVGAQHRIRLLIGQGRFEAALETLDAASKVATRERLDLLGAIAHGHLGQMNEAVQGLHAELDRHPWLRSETTVVGAWLDAKTGKNTRAVLERSLEEARGFAGRNLGAYLDMPILLTVAAEAAADFGDPDLALRYLNEAEKAHPSLNLVADVRQKIQSDSKFGKVVSPKP